MDFPERIYTLDELRTARAAIERGYRHQVRVNGEVSFKKMVGRILELVELAGYGDFLRTYVREIRQIDGISQLRETEAVIWLNSIIAQDPVEGSRLIVQKARQMQAYIEGRVWYILGEFPAVQGSIEFLKSLRERLDDPDLIERCERAIKEWTEDHVT